MAGPPPPEDPSPAYPSLEDAVAALPTCRRVPDGFFTRIEYIPESEDIHLGFCCFADDGDALLHAFQTGTPDALLSLARAQDENGQPTVSTVRLDIVHTASGRLFALQPIQYINWKPTPAAAPLILEGPEAEAWSAVLRPLDQNPPR